ncbi:hypothetical protein [Solimicrobium silvestre]|uniref:Uncharacterized protein n=1 Tax=Solimicrobium silvestre TaxID=2099400 RepID=A0A2S9H2N6_9BURK|nr:hypothetical protein [Solimicrobium silvestre]PRC94203.1 hypothetical protein S2091_0824 [Solimicrobium silvestre]
MNINSKSNQAIAINAVHDNARLAKYVLAGAVLVCAGITTCHAANSGVITFMGSIATNSCSLSSGNVPQLSKCEAHVAASTKVTSSTLTPVKVTETIHTDTVKNSDGQTVPRKIIFANYS